MRSLTSQRGLALPELLVAMVVLLVGILGVVSMVDGASEATATNKSREAATAVGREALEITRSVRYRDLTEDGLAAELADRPALADSAPGSPHTVVRRGITYTLAVSACAIDSQRDGFGSHGSGTLDFCSDSTTSGTLDRNPDDYRRVTVALTWVQNGVTKTATHRAVVNNPASGLGPAVTALDLVGPNPVTSAAATTLTFNVTTSSTPASVIWSVNGDERGLASGTGTAWTFNWGIATVRDGTYVVQARAFDAQGHSGVAYRRTVTLNRTPPAAPGGFAGGRNGVVGHVDLEWHASQEADVVGYRVYRTNSAGTQGTRACPPSTDGAAAVATATSCVDTGADLLSTQHYVVRAVDLDGAGNRREGQSSTTLAAPLGNLVPVTPAGLLLCSGSAAGCLGPDGQQAPAGTTVVSWTESTDVDGSVAFYRIYRDGIAYTNRYDRLYPSGSLKYVDRNTGGQAHVYYVTAVDNAFGESSPSVSVTG